MTIMRESGAAAVADGGEDGTALVIRKGFTYADITGESKPSAPAAAEPGKPTLAY